MENNGTFLDIIKRWMESLGINSASLFGAVLFIMIFLILIFILFAFAFRKMNLWYWKINERINFLQSIDSRLKRIEEGFSESEQNCEACSHTQEEEVSSDTRIGQAQPSDNGNKGKSGKLYTVEELELQIRE